MKITTQKPPANMDSVSPTRIPGNLGRDGYIATPPTLRAWEIYTPTTTSSHKRNRLRDTWRSFRSHSKSRVSDENSSPKTVQRRKSGLGLFASIRYRKATDMNNQQGAATTARPKTTSPSKKNSVHCKI